AKASTAAMVWAVTMLVTMWWRWVVRRPSPALKNNGSDDGDDGDDDLRTQSSDEPVCQRCGIPSNDIYGQLIRAGRDCAAGHFHPRCWTEERTKGPLRKPAMGHIIRVTDAHTGNKLDL